MSPGALLRGKLSDNMFQALGRCRLQRHRVHLCTRLLLRRRLVPRHSLPAWTRRVRVGEAFSI